MRRGEVYLVGFDNPPFGREQGMTRLAVIVQINSQNDALDTVIVVPFTKNKETLKFPSSVPVSKGDGGLDIDSVALCHQVRAVDKMRLDARPVGILSTAKFNEIRQKLAILLGFIKPS